MNIPEYMTFDFLQTLRRNHPAWRLLCADQAPLLAAFFYREFLAAHRRGIETEEILQDLDLFLYDVSQQTGELAGRTPQEYLDRWTEQGWLRKYAWHGAWYYDLTATAQKAVDWLVSLHQRAFVGTESRLHTVFGLLQEIARDTDTDAARRADWLRGEIARLQAELAQVEATGKVQPRLNELQVKERFLQAESTATALLADFREVEENFRMLTQQVRDEIVQWEKGKGELLAKVFQESDVIRDSEQGRSFAAFWRYLMAAQQQEKFRATLRQISEVPAVQKLLPEHPLSDIGPQWLQAAAAVQQTIGQLSAQIRRYVNEDYLQQEKAIYQRIANIERLAVDVRQDGNLPRGDFLAIEAAAPAVVMPMERKLFVVPRPTKLENRMLTVGDASGGKLTPLFQQVSIDPQKLRQQIRDVRGTRPEVSLKEVLQAYPLQQGITELLAYLVLASHKEGVFQPDTLDTLLFERDGRQLAAICERVVYRQEDEEAKP